MSVSWSYTLIGGNPVFVDGGSSDTSGIQYVQLALDPATFDVAVPMRWLRGRDAVLQRMRIRLRMWRGEWFLDTRIGVPYREQVLVKNPDKPLVSALFRRVVESTPGIRTVESLEAVYDRRARSVQLTGAALFVDGNLLILKDEPFIVGNS